MASLFQPHRSRAIRTQVCGCVRASQRRWARVHDVRFVATQQAQERVLEKYRAKLDQKAKREGLNGIDQLKEAYKGKISELKKRAAVPGVTAPLEPDTAAAAAAASSSQATQANWPRPPAPPAQPLDQLSPSNPNYKPPGLKTLDSYIDVGKTMQLPPKEIERVWRLLHTQSPQSLCASIPVKTWEAIYRTARRHPQFILPGLPRTSATGPSATAAEGVEEAELAVDGAPIHFMQWSFPGPDTVTVMFTHLAEYKLRGEYSQPHTTLTHHLELAGPKGLVLCQGSTIENRGVSVDEGRWLAMNMQKFYTIGEDVEARESSTTGKELKKRRRRLVEMFSQGNEEFKVEELMEEAERMG